MKGITSKKLLLVLLVALVLFAVPAFAGGQFYLVLSVFVIPSDAASQLGFGSVGIFWSTVAGMAAWPAAVLVAA